MASETTIGGRRLSPEFWAIIGSAITLLVGLIALAALMLTVSGWLREDIRAIDTKLDAKVNMLQSDLTGIRERLAAVEARIGAAADTISELERHPGRFTNGSIREKDRRS